jgi:hypothetical protein
VIVIDEHVGGSIAHEDRGTSLAVMDAVVADDDVVGVTGGITLDPDAGAVVPLFVDIESLDQPISDARLGGVSTVGLEVKQALVACCPNDW